MRVFRKFENSKIIMAEEQSSDVCEKNTLKWYESTMKIRYDTQPIRISYISACNCPCSFYDVHRNGCEFQNSTSWLEHSPSNKSTLMFAIVCILALEAIPTANASNDHIINYYELRQKKEKLFEMIVYSIFILWTLLFAYIVYIFISYKQYTVPSRMSSMPSRMSSMPSRSRSTSQSDPSGLHRQIQRLIVESHYYQDDIDPILLTTMFQLPGGQKCNAYLVKRLYELYDNPLIIIGLKKIIKECVMTPKLKRVLSRLVKYNICNEEIQNDEYDSDNLPESDDEFVKINDNRISINELNKRLLSYIAGGSGCKIIINDIKYDFPLANISPDQIINTILYMIRSHQ